MVFGLFKRKDPICGMKEEKGKGINKLDKWFCSENCLAEYRKNLAYANTEKKSEKKSGPRGCCH